MYNVPSLSFFHSYLSYRAQSNAQLASEIEVKLPKELSRECKTEIVRRYVQDNFVSVGMWADWALHDKNDGNPPVHI